MAYTLQSLHYSGNHHHERVKEKKFICIQKDDRLKRAVSWVALYEFFPQKLLYVEKF